MARLLGDYTDRSYETLMYKSSDIREPRCKVIILAAPIVPLSRGLTVFCLKVCPIIDGFDNINGLLEKFKVNKLHN